MSCLRNVRCLLSKTVQATPASEILNPCSPVLQFVRGIKPRWLPKTKSKIFYVRTPTPIDQEEAEPLKTMYFHYRTHQRAIKNFLRNQMMEKRAIALQQTKKEKDLAAEFKEMEELVNHWNSQVTSSREEAYMVEKGREDARHAKQQERVQQHKDQRLQKAQAKLEKDLEDAKSFINLDNLDNEIERLLNQRQDYNFAIDKKGNKLPSAPKASPENTESPAVDSKHESINR